MYRTQRPPCAKGAVIWPSCGQNDWGIVAEDGYELKLWGCAAIRYTRQSLSQNRFNKPLLTALPSRRPFCPLRGHFPRYRGNPPFAQGSLWRSRASAINSNLTFRYINATIRKNAKETSLCISITTISVATATITNTITSTTASITTITIMSAAVITTMTTIMSAAAIMTMPTITAIPAAAVVASTSTLPWTN